MPSIRKQSSYDGRCTVFIGEAVILADLSEAQADAIIDAYRRVVRPH